MLIFSVSNSFNEVLSDLFSQFRQCRVLEGSIFAYRWWTPMMNYCEEGGGNSLRIFCTTSLTNLSSFSGE